MILLPLITAGCKTTKIEKEIILPPKPQRQKLKNPTTWQEAGVIIDYYEHLVQDWENWGNTVTNMID